MTTEKPSWLILRETCELIDLEDNEIPKEALRAFYAAMGAFISSGAHGFWLEPDAGDGHADPQRFVVAIAGRFAALTTLWNGPSIQSPIEAQLASALLWLDIDWAGYPIVDDHGAFDRRKEGPGEAVCCYLTPQACIGSYKVDFLLWFSFKSHFAGIAIECDGHEFHEKTKEQAAHDKRRDRDILGLGFPVMRFSGSEIFRDATCCAGQVREVAAGILHRISKDGGLFK